MFAKSGLRWATIQGASPHGAAKKKRGEATGKGLAGYAIGVTLVAWRMFFLRKAMDVQGRRPWESQRILCARVRAPSYLRHRVVLPSTFSCMFFLCGGSEMLGTWLVAFVIYPVCGALLVSAPPISPTSEPRSACRGRDAPVLYSMNSYWRQIR